jgi:predicted dehydrogenase
VIHWSTGRLGNVGTHAFDALRFLLGADAQAVSGTLDPVSRPDCRGPDYRDLGGWGIVDFSSGVKGFVLCSAGCPTASVAAHCRQPGTGDRAP